MASTDITFCASASLCPYSKTCKLAYPPSQIVVLEGSFSNGKEDGSKMTSKNKRKCAHCGGSIDIRNPTGKCDHLHWPFNLSDEAKTANGYVLVEKREWVKNDL